MTLVCRGGAELQLLAAFLLSTCPFLAAIEPHGIAFSLFMALAALFALSQARGTDASWVTLSGQAIVVHYTLRPSVTFPVSAIAAVATQKRLVFTRRSIVPESYTSIRVFRRDAPGVFALRVPSDEADAFLFQLATLAKRAGVTGLRPFTVPRFEIVRSLLLLPALSSVALFPIRVSLVGILLALAIVLLDVALGRSRTTTFAKDIARGSVPKDAEAWLELLRIAPVDAA